MEAIFDPRNLLNPGNIVEPGPPSAITGRMRIEPAGQPNGRGLEVRVRTPSGFDAVGEEARGLILKALTRGQGQLSSP